MRYLVMLIDDSALILIHSDSALILIYDITLILIHEIIALVEPKYLTIADDAKLEEYSVDYLAACQRQQIYYTADESDDSDLEDELSVYRPAKQHQQQQYQQQNHNSIHIKFPLGLHQ